jgi:hypothetical protein
MKGIWRLSESAGVLPKSELLEKRGKMRVGDRGRSLAHDHHGCEFAVNSDFTTETAPLHKLPEPCSLVSLSG